MPSSLGLETSYRDKMVDGCQTPPVRVVAAAGAGFLLAVLWFDLMFDVQVRRHQGGALPAEVRSSIATYYRRVTTTAGRMKQLVAAVMVATLVALIAELVASDVARWRAAVSLVLTGAAVTLAAVRTVRSAVRLGAQTDSADVQASLARAIYRDHVACFLAISCTLVIQILPT